jgi:hypothetical protein
MNQPNSPIIAKVCKSAAQSINRFDKSKDLLCAKITNIHEDGTRSNSFVALENYKQPFWIVKEDKRKFKQHKDYIEETACKEYRAPRCQLGYAVSKYLYGSPDRSYSVRQASDNCFVFGLDQTPPVHFKRKFFERYGDHQETEAYTMASYDVETDMFKPNNPVMMASVTFKGKAFFAGVRGWFKEKHKDRKRDLTDEMILNNLKEAEDKHLKSHLERRKCEVEYLLVDTPGQVVAACIQKMHEWEPDWVTAWNALYDMTKNEEALMAEGYDLADVYSDPRIPYEYKSYKLHPGRTHKVKEDGTKTPLEWQEKFPTVRTMASWQFADAGSFYAIKRQPVVGKLESYALQAIADREKVPGKLYTEEGRDHDLGSPQWHRYMQENWPYIYAMYNICDNFVIEEINENTNDFSLSLPMLLKYSEYFNYVSQPKLISDTLSFMARERGYVWGSTPGNRDKSFSEKLPTLGDWIALLDTEKNASFGKALFAGLDDVFSNGRTDTSDIDVEGAYPHVTLALNASNRTTMMEAYQIQGADPMKFREIGVNYASSTEANAFGLCHDLFRFPQPDKLKEVFEDRMNQLGLIDELAMLKKNLEAKRQIATEEDLTEILEVA